MPDVYVSDKKKPSVARPEHGSGEDKHKEVPIGKVTEHRHKIGPFTSFALHPKNVHFENEKKGEEVVLFLRQHPIVNIPWISLALIMVIVPVFLPFFPILDFLPFGFQVVSVLIWYLIVSAFVLEQGLSWVFNIYIITNFRVVDIDFFNLIQKQVSDAEREKIQDVTYQMGGVGGTFFNYGNVLIQTAGTAPNFDFSRVAEPREVVKTLQDIQHLGKDKGEENV